MKLWESVPQPGLDENGSVSLLSKQMMIITGSRMTDAEVEFVAQELAKSSGVKWPNANNQSPIQRIVADRFRDRARAAIAGLDRYRNYNAQMTNDNLESDCHPLASGAVVMAFQEIGPGATVVYRPPGDRRAYRCRIEKINGSRAYLVPLEASHAYLVRIDDVKTLQQA